MSEFSIEAAGERLELLHDRALHWPRRRSLIVADTHFAKDDVFRRSGFAWPRGATPDDLARLTRLLQRTGAERLLVLGDFLHARLDAADSFVTAFALWRRQHAQLAVDVVGGNHDAREPRARWSGQLSWRLDPYLDGPFAFVHAPREVAGAYALGGHLHPVVLLPEPGRRSIRVAVFWVRPTYLVLPSFGSLTGGHPVRPAPEDGLFAVGPERIVALGSRLKFAAAQPSS